MLRFRSVPSGSRARRVGGGGLAAHVAARGGRDGGPSGVPHVAPRRASASARRRRVAAALFRVGRSARPPPPRAPRASPRGVRGPGRARPRRGVRAPARRALGVAARARHGLLRPSDVLPRSRDGPRGRRHAPARAGRRHLLPPDARGVRGPPSRRRERRGAPGRPRPPRDDHARRDRPRRPARPTRARPPRRRSRRGGGGGGGGGGRRASSSRSSSSSSSSSRRLLERFATRASLASPRRRGSRGRPRAPPRRLARLDPRARHPSNVRGSRGGAEEGAGERSPSASLLLVARVVLSRALARVRRPPPPRDGRSARVVGRGAQRAPGVPARAPRQRPASNRRRGVRRSGDGTARDRPGPVRSPARRRGGGRRTSRRKSHARRR